MSEITANWIFVGQETFQRAEIYGLTWSQRLVSEVSPSGSDFGLLVGAPFGGPIVQVHDHTIRIYKASGEEICSWLWKNSRIVTVGWSNTEQVVFVVEDGSVFVYDVFGTFVKMFGMGQEAKDLKIQSAKVFSNPTHSGVAVLTNSKRFFVVNNIQEPRVRRMPDFEIRNLSECNWEVLANSRQASILVVTEGSLMILSQTDVSNLESLGAETTQNKACKLSLSFDYEMIAVFFHDGNIWLGTTEMKISTFKVNYTPDFMFWISNRAVALFSKSKFQCQIINLEGESEETFVPDLITAVQEIDGVRMLCSSSQELLLKVPDSLIATYDLRVSNSSPSANLRYAAEEFAKKSHKANDYLQQISEELDSAVTTCMQGAGQVLDPIIQKELLRAAQFGKSFLQCSTALSGSAEMFRKTCQTLRILNTLRDHRVGMPLTSDQYNFLGPRVVVDRLLQRRLYPLALKVCQLLKIPTSDGESRVLAHWAAYKVMSAAVAPVDGQNLDDSVTAKAISQRLGKHPHISYSDIAAKAADCGKKELAVKLLEHEVKVSKQIPLLIQLGHESTALIRALNSGDRDLCFSVILHLRAELSSSEFHSIIRKYPMARVLYEKYCREYECETSFETLYDWLIQEDDFKSLAEEKFKEAYDNNRIESRMSLVRNAKENWSKAKMENWTSLADDNLKLLALQSKLEKDFPASQFVGLSVNETLSLLFDLKEPKMCEKVKSELKVSDKRFSWLKARSLIRGRQWEELKKMVKQKKTQQPLSVSQLIHLVKDLAGQEEARQFLNDDLITNHREQFDLYKEFGMFIEAANAAFLAKSIESLNALETLCSSRDDALRTISNLKSRLINK